MDVFHLISGTPPSGTGQQFIKNFKNSWLLGGRPSLPVDELPLTTQSPTLVVT